MIGTIPLDPEEHAALGEIEFNVHALKDHLAVRQNAERACALTKRLIARGAIPEGRKRYLTDADYHLGRGKTSRIQSFQRNGNHGDDLFKHPHFLPHLWFLIHGSALPESVRTCFISAIEDCGGVTSGDVIPLGTLARTLIKSHGLRPDVACEEFFKLAIDLDLSLMTASAIRNRALGR